MATRPRSPRLMTLIATLAVGVAAFEGAVLVHGRLTSVSIPVGVPEARPSDCVPGDQDPYVYSPDRLHVLAACLRVTGTVRGISVEADGDQHIQVELDAPYWSLLTPGNDTQFGRLVVEPVCVGDTDEPDAKRACAGDRDPVVDLPTIGQHVWIEGRYVVDSNHYYWAEFHPLYAWGPAAGGTG